ncbi:MAG: hypothetical protein HYX78_01865 [Armatimonadetes bacterium]|nr:hypothetical protein [Armatimonadota bacterium]
MFDQTQRLLRQWGDSVSAPIPMPLDDDGYLDRKCPSSRCKSEFKVMMDDWKEKVPEEEAYCPICGRKSDPSAFNTKQQNKYIRDYAFRYISDQLGEALRRDTQSFNRSQPRGGFITMSMSYKPGPRQVVVPYEVAEMMRQRFECEGCHCRYSAFGAAFFCPACGHNSAATMFEVAVDAVRKTVAHIPDIRQSMPDRDTAENVQRLMLEESFTKLVAAFQRFAEATFDLLPTASHFKRRKNVFQSIAESSDLWRKAAGKGYDELVPRPDLEELVRYFQQRHLLAHKDGIIDQEYIDKTGDRAYRVGERLVIREKAVLRLAELLSLLASCLRRLT